MKVINKINEEIAQKNKKKRIKPEFKNRHRARELAAQFLYSLDSGANSAANYDKKKIDLLLDLFSGSGGIAEDETPEVKEYFYFLSRGTWEAKAEIDEILLRVVSGWRPDRLNAVDRAILRLTIFEGFLSKRLPFKSAIIEAMNISNVFGSEKSPRFIHGVLARVLKYMLSREIFEDDFENDGEDEKDDKKI